MILTVRIVILVKDLKIIETFIFVTDTLRYLSLHDNRYLRYFKGHRSRVVSMAMSPHDDSFASASLDYTIRFWDLKSNNCRALLNTSDGRSSISFDPKYEHVIAVATPINQVKMFDDRYLDKGPFATHFIDANPLDFIDAQYSPKGSHLLLSTTKSIVVLNPMTGATVRCFVFFCNIFLLTFC